MTRLGNIKRLVYDIEADGFLREASKIHCIVAKEVGVEKIYKFYSSSLTKKNILDMFLDFDQIICHNQIFYDIPMIKKFLDIDVYSIYDIEDIIDTYIMSQVLNPDRGLPNGCPTIIRPSGDLKSLGYKSKRVGSHGLESWGWRVGNIKPFVHDWKEFNNEIINRCEQDVIINERAYITMLKEADL